MSLTKSLAKSTLSILASQVASTLISIAFIAYFARVFSKEQMAVYATLSVLSGWTALVGGMGMGTLLEKNIAQFEAAGQKQQAVTLISSVIVYRTLVMAVVSLAFYYASRFIAASLFENHDYIALVKYVVVISFFMAFSASLGVIQVACQRFVSRSAIGVVEMVLQRTLCVAGYLYEGISGFFTGYLMATLVGTILCLWDIREYLTWDLMPFAKVFRESRMYFGLVALKGTIDQVDRPLIAVFLGAEALAGYHVAKRLYDNLYGLVMAFIDPASVKFGEARAKGRYNLKIYYKNIMVIIIHMFIPFGFFLMVVSKSLLLLYGGEKYANSYLVLTAFNFTLMTVVLWTIVRQAALRLISARHLALQYLVTAATTFLAYVVLLPALGDVGIPLAMGIGYVAGLVPIVYQLKRQWELSFPWRSVASTLGCGLCILTTMAPAAIFSPGLGEVLFVSVLSTSIYLAWLHFLGPQEVGNVLRSVYVSIPASRRFLPSKYS